MEGIKAEQVGVKLGPEPLEAAGVGGRLLEQKPSWKPPQTRSAISWGKNDSDSTSDTEGGPLPFQRHLKCLRTFTHAGS